MKLLEIRPRRRELTALVFDREIDPKDYGFSVDAAGLPTVDAGLAAEKGLAVGMSLSDEDWKALAAASEEKRAKSRALWYLERGSLSKKQLTDKLARAFSRETARKVADRMEELGYIDDVRYAERLAELLLTERKVGTRKALATMITKGVDRETAKEALEAVETDPVDAVLAVIRSKYADKLGDPKSIQKTIAALARRGFSFSDIREALRRMKTDYELIEEEPWQQ